MKVRCYIVFADKNDKIIPDKKEGIVGFKWVSLKLAYRLLKYKDEKDTIKKLLNHFPFSKQ